jgi:hypothetical protein
MALPTTMQYSESNLIGYLNTGITASGTTITVRFYDKITGEVRTPLSTTLLFVIDKGSEVAPNRNYEIVLATAHTTTNGVTTMTGCVRGLAMSGSSLAAGTGKSHPGESEVGCVDVHFNWTTIIATLKGAGDTVIVPTFASLAALATDVPSPTNGMPVYVTGVGFLSRQNSAWFGTPMLIFADDAARDAAIPSPVNGMKVYNIADGAFQGYIGGSWTDEGTSTTPNMSLTVAGKGEEATAAEIIANTQTGSTGADLIVNPKYLSDASVTTSAGAADADKYVRANASGLIDSTLLTTNPTPTYTTVTAGNFYDSDVAGETLVANDWVYVKASDSKLYKATNTSIETATVVGVIITGGNANDTVTYQFGGVYTTSALTNGAAQYLGTGGARTETHPAMNSGSVIPVKLGIASGTTKLIINIERLARFKAFGDQRASGAGSGNQDITIGFTCGSVMINAIRSIGGTQPGGSSTGFSDLISSTHFTNNNNVSAVLITESDGGGGTALATISALGTDIRIAWSMTSFTSGDAINFMGVAYEKI